MSFSDIDADRFCLVVDDSRVVRRIGCRIIESFGFECAEAVNGRDALDNCRARMPDVILLDWNMPIMDGYEFLQALREYPGGNRPIVIFCTTENEIAQIRKAIGAGANEYIMKPFDEGVIRDKFVQTGLLAA